MPHPKSTTRKALLNALHAIADARGNADDLITGLRDALLAYGSETPDNVSCAARLDLLAGKAAGGLKLGPCDVPLADLAHAVEDLSLPAEIKARFPAIDVEDWDAFTRLTTLIFCALQAEGPPDKPACNDGEG